jgi:lysophospholipase L1-like esterase
MHSRSAVFVWGLCGLALSGGAACSGESRSGASGNVGASSPPATPQAPAAAAPGTSASDPSEGASATPTTEGEPSTTAPTAEGASGPTTLTEMQPSAMDPPLPAPEAPLDTSLHVYTASDVNVQIWGRVDRTDPAALTYSAPGVAVTARFRGDAISIVLGDEFRYGNERGFHDVLIDGALAGKLTMTEGQDKYVLASGLPVGEHTATVVKRTQASLGKSIFRGFEVNGELVAPGPAPALKIEFIGDSITAGEGVEGVNNSAECQQNAQGAAGGWGQPFHNADRSYGAVAARALNAQFHLTAASGIGLVRNYSQQYDARTMADVYDLLFIEETASAPWDHALFVPDVVAIALGTNDFSPGDAPANMPRSKMSVATYTDAYVAFVTKLRAYYPNAEIFAVTSPLLGDGYPDASYTSATDLRTAVANAASRLNQQGDAKVHAYVSSTVSGQGCTGHPNVQQQEALGQELAQEIRRVLGLN